MDLTAPYEEVNLTPEQAEHYGAAMLNLAAVDGVHPDEWDLIRGFYVASGGKPEDLVGLGRTFDLATAAASLRTAGPKVIEALVISLFLVIYADGTYSDAERTWMKGAGHALGLDEDRLENLHFKARMFLLHGVAEGLKNREAVSKVADDISLDTHNVTQATEK